jgi:NAD(P)-dependent dehydrogenase (short-subunit alcohol dehydrogenase family)
LTDNDFDKETATMDTKKTFLITGATAGIGRETALHLARRGHTVFATGRNDAALAALAREAGGLPLQTLRLDVTSPASIGEAHGEILRRTGGAGIDVLVNNAGYGKGGPLEEVSDAELRGQYDTNVFGLMAVTRAFLPQLRARRGRVINVSSIGGKVSMPFMGAYNSTKFAVEALSDALRVELAPAGIDVVLVEPGPIRTNFEGTFVQDIAQYQRPDSPYAATFERLEAVRKSFDRFAVGPEVIARAIERAGTARRPRARYVAPFSQHFGLWFLTRIPTRLRDFIMRKAMGMPARGKAAAPALPASTGPGPRRELPAA